MNSPTAEPLSAQIQPTELTPRQRQILLLIAEGLTAKEIATRTKLSPKTIEFHKAALYDRIGMRSTAGLVRYALRQGLIVDQDVRLHPKVFRVVFYCDELDGSLAAAHVRAIDTKEAEQKLRARLSHLREIEVMVISEAEGMFILD